MQVNQCCPCEQSADLSRKLFEGPATLYSGAKVEIGCVTIYVVEYKVDKRTLTVAEKPKDLELLRVMDKKKEQYEQRKKVLAELVPKSSRGRKLPVKRPQPTLRSSMPSLKSVLNGKLRRSKLKISFPLKKKKKSSESSPIPSKEKKQTGKSKISSSRGRKNKSVSFKMAQKPVPDQEVKNTEEEETEEPQPSTSAVMKKSKPLKKQNKKSGPKKKTSDAKSKKSSKRKYEEDDSYDYDLNEDGEEDEFDKALKKIRDEENAKGPEDDDIDLDETLDSELEEQDVQEPESEVIAPSNETSSENVSQDTIDDSNEIVDEDPDHDHSVDLKSTEVLESEEGSQGEEIETYDSMNDSSMVAEDEDKSQEDEDMREQPPDYSL